MKLLYIVCISFMLVGCVANKSVPIVEKEYVSDMVDIPQNPVFYAKGIDKGEIGTLDEYEHRYFRVWNLDKVDIELKDAMWAYDAFVVGSSYGENLQLLQQDFFDSIIDNSNFDAYGTLNEKAITLTLVNVRAFPTDKPLLRDPNKAGEGFPFDYLQNTTIAPNKPLLLSHYSKDKAWVFVLSSFASGWVKANSVAVLDKQYTDVWQKAEQVFITKGGVPIYDEEGTFLFYSRIGMMLALINEDAQNYTVLTIAKSTSKKPIYIQSKISKFIAHKGILAFNETNITAILDDLMKTNYGWGGIYGQRDCSSTLRDFYAPFGLWLPRNSYQQSRIGEKVMLSGLKEEEIVTTIKQNAVAFETLLYKQGHIVIYAGIYNDKIIVFQNVWGVKTRKNDIEGRFVIGKTIFSTLEVGKNLKEFDENASFLKNIKSLNRITKENPL